MNKYNLRFHQNLETFSLMIMMYVFLFFVKAQITFVVNSTNDSIVLRNYIGLNLYGEALHNQNGIRISGLSENNVFVGSVPIIIYGNTSNGIIIKGKNALNDLIGLNTNSNISIPNNVGVFILNLGGNTIGGTIWSDTHPP